MFVNQDIDRKLVISEVFQIIQFYLRSTRWNERGAIIFYLVDFGFDIEFNY